MIVLLDNLITQGAAFVPLVVGLVQLCKLLGLPSRWAPLASLVLGLAAGLTYVSADPADGVLAGVVIALAASGLWSSGKAAVESVRGE